MADVLLTQRSLALTAERRDLIDFTQSEGDVDGDGPPGLRRLSRRARLFAFCSAVRGGRSLRGASNFFAMVILHVRRAVQPFRDTSTIVDASIASDTAAASEM